MDYAVNVITLIQFFFAIVIGLYFLNLQRAQQGNRVAFEWESKKEMETKYLVMLDNGAFDVATFVNKKFVCKGLNQNVVIASQIVITKEGLQTIPVLI